MVVVSIWRSEPWIEEINKRVANLTRTPVGYQEAVQVLRYKPGQYYGAHLDYTNRLNYGENLPKMQASAHHHDDDDDVHHHAPRSPAPASLSRASHARPFHPF